jgi:uncharacterized protein (TIGR00375 family)
MTPEEIWRWSQLKGITAVGTGDFTHPQWLGELRDKLEPIGNGLFRLREECRRGSVPDSCKASVRFLLSAEISCVYSKYGRTRKVHALVLVPDFEDADRINAALSLRGNLASDGRPILGMDVADLARIVRHYSPQALFIPAHAGTPHFSVFGAASGFDSIEECFDGIAGEIVAIETGLSSDPPMNWRVSSLDAVTLVSNSDAHSPSKLGREATIFDTAVSFETIAQAIRTKRGLLGTVEFFPEEGKYHLDGHRGCGVSLTPEQTVRQHYLCPVCGRKVTVGVMHRVEALADRPPGHRPADAPAFSSLIPLQELIAETVRAGVNTKTVTREYHAVISALGNELSVLMDVPIRDIETAGSPRLADAIARVRAGKVSIAPGFDGEYGKVHVLDVSRSTEREVSVMSVSG